jgi:fumarylacetoacetase
MTWLDLPPGTGFGLANLPFGVFSRARGRPRAGVAIGGWVLDVAAVADDLRLPLREEFAEPALNRFLAAGPVIWREARERLTEWLTSPAHRAVVEPHLVPLGEARLHLPFEVADYVDFYASRNHAENVGRIFRPGQPPLPRNWLHMPLGYHGRAGSVVVSGTPGRRSARPYGSISRQRSDSWPVCPPRRGGRCRSPPLRSTCSACAWSTTGPPGTSRRSRPCRLARS